MKKKVLTVIIPIIATTLVVLGCGKGGKTTNTTTDLTTSNVADNVRVETSVETPEETPEETPVKATLESWLNEAGNEDALLNKLGVGGVQDGYNAIYVDCYDNDLYIVFQFDANTVTDELLEAGFADQLYDNLTASVTPGVCKYDVNVIESLSGIAPEVYGFSYETIDGAEITTIAYTYDEIINAQ